MFNSNKIQDRRNTLHVVYLRTSLCFLTNHNMLQYKILNQVCVTLLYISLAFEFVVAVIYVINKDYCQKN